MSTPKSNMLVSEVMLTLDLVPLVHEEAILKEAMEEMGRTRLGIVCVIGADKSLLGILTDGDIRRKLLKVQKPFSALLIDDTLDHAIRTPTTIDPDDTLVRAIELMEEKKIWDLPAVSKEGKLVGLLHLHPAVKALL